MNGGENMGFSWPWLLITLVSSIVSFVVVIASKWGIRIALRLRPIEIHARLGSLGGRTYFPDDIDEVEIKRRLRQPSTADASRKTLSPRTWIAEVFAEHGGVPQLGPVIVSIRNWRKEAVAIEDVRSEVVRRLPTHFAAKHDPPIGGPDHRVRLAFDLDRVDAPGRLIDPDSPLGHQPQRGAEYSYLAAQNLWVPPNGEPIEIVASPQSQSTRAEVVEWVLCLTARAKGWRGQNVTKTHTVTIDGKPIRGVPNGFRPKKIYDFGTGIG